jgi:anthranilate synthase/aminodeoxychorismate synthase-like glutamine amidotransferase
VITADAFAADALLAEGPHGLVLSAGPCTPAEARESVALVRSLGRRRGPPRPGVWLGHQVIACAFGGRVVRARKPVHGSVVRVHHDGRGLFAELVNPLEVARYNSLTVDGAALPTVLEVSARDEDGEVMALRHRRLDIEGVQFHPESWLGHASAPLFERWAERCARYVRALGVRGLGACAEGSPRAG